jgi:flavin-dependent dehydrogenase
MSTNASDRQRSHDAIVVGARCAGAPIAMLLARMGYDVVLQDRVHFPSDTVSTHLVHPSGIAALERWGLLDRLIATGCPPITSYSFDFGPFAISGRPQIDDGPGTAYCPRRLVLDAMLVDAAVGAGAALQDGVTFDDVLVEDGRVVGVRSHTAGGDAITERARVVIGADGAHSRVARAVGADEYRAQPELAAAYYSYWSDVPADGASWALRPRRGYGMFATNDGLTMVLAAWPRREIPSMKGDVEHMYLSAVHDTYGELLSGATRQERIVGGGVENRFRTPFGPGWALVGDAGYLKDPVTAQGMTDAFLDAERCAAAIDDGFSGRRPIAEAMAAYQHDRDERALPMYELTTQLATLEPPPPEMAQVLAAAAGNRRAMDDFASVIAGTMAPTDFFAAQSTGT